MSEKCGGHCKPINAYKGRYQLVEATEDTGLYARGTMHMPCRVPGCECSKLIRDLPEEKPRPLTGDADLDRLDRELRERLRASGLNY